MLFNRLLAPFTNNIIDRPNNHKTRLKVVCAIFCFLKITSFHTPHNNFKRGCQHPLNKFEILWHVAKIFFSLLLLYFVAQYFQIIVVFFFFWKYVLVFEKWLYSFDRVNMQISTVNITQVVWPHEAIPLDLRHFCQHNTLFYPLSLLKLAKKYLFLGEYFCPTYFSYVEN